MNEPTSLIAIAGISGYTGQRLLPLLDADPKHFRLLMRRRTAERAPWRDDARVRAVDLLDEADLEGNLKGVETIICLVGTTAAQFRPAEGGEPAVNYETVDIGIPRALANAGKRAGCKRFVLLTSFGIELPGQYNMSKRAAEEAVLASGLSTVMLRPSFITGPGRMAPKVLEPIWSLVGVVSRGRADDVRSIDADVLARAAFVVARSSKWDGRVLTGRDLHAIANGA